MNVNWKALRPREPQPVELFNGDPQGLKEIWLRQGFLFSSN
jgi:hypothetical protein